MINTLNDTNELIKTLRSLVIEQTGLTSEQVLNGLSLYGSSLEKRLMEQSFVSFNTNDAIIVFQLLPRSSSSNYTESNHNSITVVSSYSFKMIIYGRDSMLFAQIIKARFESEEIRQTLFSKAVYLEDISEPSELNEFINDTMWLRTDISINVSCRMSIQKHLLNDPFTTVGKLELIDEMPSNDSGYFSGTVIDATNGNGIANILVSVYNSFNTLVGSYTTGLDGNYTTNELPYNKYTVVFTSTEHTEAQYIEDRLLVNLNEKALEHQDIVLSQITSDNEMRIVLTWKESPEDLDSHLVTDTGYYVDYTNKSTDGGNIVLDVDDIFSFGPETITIHDIRPNTVYHYYVHNYSHEEKLYASGAVVKIYFNGNIEYTLTVPTIGENELYWDVFTYSNTSGFDIINKLTDNEPIGG